MYNDSADLRMATESDIDAPSDGGRAAHSYIAFYVEANERIDNPSSAAASARPPAQATNKAEAQAGSASSVVPLRDTAIRAELKRMWETDMEQVPESVKCYLGSHAFEQFVAEKWSSVAARLDMEAKKDAGAVVFVPRINVEFGASDQSVVDARRRLL